MHTYTINGCTLGAASEKQELKTKAALHPSSECDKAQNKKEQMDGMEAHSSTN